MLLAKESPTWTLLLLLLLIIRQLLRRGRCCSSCRGLSHEETRLLARLGGHDLLVRGRAVVGEEVAAVLVVGAAARVPSKRLIELTVEAGLAELRRVACRTSLLRVGAAGRVPTSSLAHVGVELGRQYRAGVGHRAEQSGSSTVAMAELFGHQASSWGRLLLLRDSTADERWREDGRRRLGWLLLHQVRRLQELSMVLLIVQGRGGRRW